MYPLIGYVVEKFTNPGAPMSQFGLMGASVAILLLIVLELFVVQWLWNNVLVRVTTLARPIPSLLYTLGLLVLLQMVFHTC